MRKTFKTFILITASALALAGCNSPQTTANQDASVAVSTELINANNKAINDWFENAFNDAVARSPMDQTYLGIKGEDYGKWDDPSEENAQQELEISKALLAEMKTTFDPAALGETEALSYQLMKAQLEDEIEGFKWRNHSYPFNQMFGVHSGTPAFLINQHTVTSLEDAQAYISRIEGVKDYMAANVKRSETSVAMGVQPPKFVYDLLLDDIGNLTKGAPFDDGEPSALLADFTTKVEELDIDDREKRQLINQASRALRTSFRPAYRDLTAALRRQSRTATTDDGAWKLPEGSAYYASRLREMTTTDMSADEIHDLGLSEVARIHDEMRTIMTEVDFDGDLQDFFVYMRNDPDGKFVYPDTQEGKARYLAEAESLINTMKARLDEVFITKPKADLFVKAVEPFREKTAGKAFYSSPAPDGSRPGIYYANLYDMASMPTYQMEALAYHEGIPGHHMQLAISQELTGIPQFRKYASYTAYIEGWGLYSEYLPKEMGFYQDPYSDFGRLAMELWRAARLVVDTGLHDKKWTREQAIDYLVTNTPNTEEDCRKSIERYIVMPGQATAYKIGMIKIQQLREQAKADMGQRFDLRQFHDIILESGPVPLGVLEARVKAWSAG